MPATRCSALLLIALPRPQPPFRAAAGWGESSALPIAAPRSIPKSASARVRLRISVR
jgi:hypothetical protein